MPRALFEKTGNAVYISHLDLMRVFQRAFKRAGLPLTHTQGFSPRPSVSIALPMSVGVQSHCELLDFELDGEAVSCEEIQERLNKALVDGVRVLQVYDSCEKIRGIAYLDCTVSFEYDRNITENDADTIRELFSRATLIVEKKGKNGITQQDIIPMLRGISVTKAGDREIIIEARVCCQNPTLNPAQLTAAVEYYLPDLAPAFACYCRNEIYDCNDNVFR